MLDPCRVSMEILEDGAKREILMVEVAHQYIRKSCAIYARFSSDLQSDSSIEDQIRTCRARAEREGWHLVATFTDAAISGATNLRPGYQALLTGLQGGTIDIVLAESLDRFSRDLEHTASFFKQCVFYKARIHTVSEGDVSELHIGLKGTMGALYLKDLADKTRRGLEGRIQAGRCAGPAPYGYTVVRRLKDDGELDRGLRAIDPDRAAIVRRVFEAYAIGYSPRRIAQSLNADGIPGPSGGMWYGATLLGHSRRCDGLLRNELYVGRLVWRRRTNIKDPASGVVLRRDARLEDRVTKEMPQLRIVDEPLWQRVQERLQQESAPLKTSSDGGERAFWDRRRPRHLLSGKVFCGACGRPFLALGRDYLGCNAARHGSCANTKTVRRVRLEAHVMDLLRRKLMQPDHLAEFAAAFNDAPERLVVEAKAQAAGRQRDRVALDRKIANLIDAISDGRSSLAILAKLAELEAQRGKLGEAKGLIDQPALVLHPGMSQIYATTVQNLSAALAERSQPETLEAARALIEKVIIHAPENKSDPPGVELIGQLAALLRTAGVGHLDPPESSSDPGSVLATFVSSAKVDPGTCPRRAKHAFA